MPNRTIQREPTAIAELRDEIARRPSDPATERRFERARRDIVYEEVAASCAVAGVQLTPGAIRRLVERGIAPPGRLEDHLLVLGYARAAIGIAREGPFPGHVRRLVSVPEIERLHQTITSSVATMRVGSPPPQGWRRRNLPPVRAGMVTLPHWLIEFEMASLADRIGSGPRSDAELFTWLAGVYERLERIRPFVEGNGRVARLVVNLLLARLGYPPATIGLRRIEAFRRALQAADAGVIAPLAGIFELAVARNLERLAAAGLDAATLRPLATFACSGISVDALRKAAQRGRLRTIARGRELFATQAWIDRYLGEKSRAGRPPSSSS